jgi:hypothetical protein
MCNAAMRVKINPITTSRCIFLVLALEVKTFLLGNGYYCLQKTMVFKERPF